MTRKTSDTLKSVAAGLICVAVFFVAAWINSIGNDSSAASQRAKWGSAQAAIIEARPEVERSPEWPRVRDEHLKLHPACAVCGRTDGCEVHHITPFHLDNSKELDKNNLITLCGPPWNHHFWFGHLGNWKSYNPSVLADVAAWRAKIASRPSEK